MQDHDMATEFGAAPGAAGASRPLNMGFPSPQLLVLEGGMVSWGVL